MAGTSFNPLYTYDPQQVYLANALGAGQTKVTAPRSLGETNPLPFTSGDLQLAFPDVYRPKIDPVPEFQFDNTGFARALDLPVLATGFHIPGGFGQAAKLGGGFAPGMSPFDKMNTFQNFFLLTEMNTDETSGISEPEVPEIILINGQEIPKDPEGMKVLARLFLATKDPEAQKEILSLIIKDKDLVFDFYNELALLTKDSPDQAAKLYGVLVQFTELDKNTEYFNAFDIYFRADDQGSNIDLQELYVQSLTLPEESQLRQDFTMIYREVYSIGQVVTGSQIYFTSEDSKRYFIAKLDDGTFQITRKDLDGNEEMSLNIQDSATLANISTDDLSAEEKAITERLLTTQKEEEEAAKRYEEYRRNNNDVASIDSFGFLGRIGLFGFNTLFPANPGLDLGIGFGLSPFGSIALTGLGDSGTLSAEAFVKEVKQEADNQLEAVSAKAQDMRQEHREITNRFERAFEVIRNDKEHRQEQVKSAREERLQEDKVIEDRKAKIKEEIVKLQTIKAKLKEISKAEDKKKLGNLLQSVETFINTLQSISGADLNIPEDSFLSVLKDLAEGRKMMMEIFPELFQNK